MKLGCYGDKLPLSSSCAGYKINCHFLSSQQLKQGSSSSKTYLVSEKPSLLHVKYLLQKSSSNPRNAQNQKLFTHQVGNAWRIDSVNSASAGQSHSRACDLPGHLEAWGQPSGTSTAAPAVSGFAQGT